MEEKYGVIDIGSNSVRLLISGNTFSVTNKEVCTTQLAQGLAKNGVLSEAKMDETISAVSAFFSKAKTLNCKNVFVFATEAVRAAKNGVIFKEKLERRINANLDVISGALEAQCGFMGATSGLEGIATVVDIGGASVEVITGRGEEIFQKESLPFGMIILKETLSRNFSEIDTFFKEKLSVLTAIKAPAENDKTQSELYTKAQSEPYTKTQSEPYTKTQSEPYTKTQSEPLGKMQNGDLFFIGGTPTTIASMLLKQRTYDSQKTHMLCIKKRELVTLLEEISEKSAEEISAVYPTVSLKRAEVIYYGIATIICILSRLNSSEFFVSELDNLEGYLMYKLKSNC